MYKAFNIFVLCVYFFLLYKIVIELKAIPSKLGKKEEVQLGKYLESLKMKKGIHPKYKKVNVTCACGNTFETKSTNPNISKVEICSNCHPFYTGKMKLVDSMGRVDKFMNRYKTHIDKKKN